MKQKDTIDFKINLFKHSETYKTIDIYINGVNIVEMLRKYEKDFAGSIAGGYSGVDNYEFHHIKEGKPRRKDGDFDILACECGELGCWNFVANIEETEDSVIWKNFKQPRRDWDYSDFGPFVFDRKEYKKKIGRVHTVNPASL